MRKKKIYIAHQYGDASHFKALYDYADRYGYTVSNQIILGKTTLRNKVKMAIKDRQYKTALNMLWNKLRFFTLRNKILIVGLAPYDGMMLKFEKIFKRNRCFYMTSWTTWDGTDFPRGSLENKDEYERILKECFEGAYCVSEKTQKCMQQFFEKTSVVNHAIDYNLYKKKDLLSFNEKKKYLYVGQYIERKNIKYILAWIQKCKFENIELAFAGGGELEYLIEEVAKVDDRIQNFGFCSKQQLQELICQYDYLVLPSEAEPFGIVLLEALAAGVPCVVSNVDGPMEIIEDGLTGFMFDIKTGKTGFGQAMERSYLTTREEYIEMSKHALAEGKKYDGENLVKRWMELIDN